MKPIFKIGQKVKVLAETEEPNHYRFGFVETMLEEYGGKIVTIDGIEEAPLYALDPTKIPDDGYKYIIKEDYGMYNWASSMFVTPQTLSNSNKEKIKIKIKPKKLIFNFKL